MKRTSHCRGKLLPDLAKLTAFDGECAIAAYFIGSSKASDASRAVANASTEGRGLKEKYL
jgi:hypothetical protein